jgi:AraC family transcriptional regulator
VLKLEHVRVAEGEVPEAHFSNHSLGVRLSAPGMVEMRIAGQRPHRSTARPGDICFVSAGVPLSAWQQRQTDFLAAGLAPAYVAAIAEQTGVDGCRVEFTNPCTFQDAAVHHLLFALAAEVQAGCPAGRLYGESLAMALAVHLLRHYSVFPFRTASCRGGLSPARLRRVLDCIASDLSGDTSLRRLAEVAQLSPHHFAGAFKESTGLPPHRYVLQQKVARAKELLADPRLSLAEISYAVGFPSQAHFTTMFRKLTGTTPGTFRTQL